MLSSEILVVILFIGLAIVILFASILALQRRRTWGTWLMFGGIVGTILSGIGFAGLLRWMEFLWKGLLSLRTRLE